MTLLNQPRNHSDITPIIDKAAAIIFDNDGTLVDTMPVHFTAWKRALNTYNLQFSENHFYQLAGLPAHSIINLLKEQQNLPNVTVDQVIHARHQVLKNILHTVKPIQPTVKLLQYAQAKNIPLAVASGGERNDVIASLRFAGIDLSIFGAIITANDVVNGKPHPETFLTAAKTLGVDPTKCVGFEDADKGLDALRAAGMHAIDVRLVHGYPLPECLRSFPSPVL